MALMGLVLLLIFGLLIGRPYLHERVLQEYDCKTFNVTEKGRNIACNATEKSRDSKFPCFTILAELTPRVEQRNGTTTVNVPIPTRHESSTEPPENAKFVSIYDNYVTYEKFLNHELQCSTFPCHVPPLQNQREAELFVKNHGMGKTYKCYFHDTFDQGAAILNRTVDEIQVVELMAWPAGAFVSGVLLIFIIHLWVGCSIWEDTVMV